jgi:hypothetical protein
VGVPPPARLGKAEGCFKKEYNRYCVPRFPQISKAQIKIMKEAYWMPFFIVHQIYGRNKNLQIVVGKDKVPRYHEAYWK